MPSVRIVADSGSDFPAPLAKNYAVTIVPLYLRFGLEEYPQDAIAVEEFWRRMAQPGIQVATAQPSAGDWQKVFQRLTEDGSSVVCITVTSKHSGTYNTAKAVARQFGGRVAVVDSLSASLGTAMLVLDAARQAERGNSQAQIVGRLEELRARLHATFVISTLEHLRRGGRAARLIPVVERVAKVLSIQPVLEFADGELRLQGSVRTLKGAINRLYDDVARSRPVEYLALAHTRLPVEFQAMVERIVPVSGVSSANLMQAEVGPVLSAHAGPGALGAAYISR